MGRSNNQLRATAKAKNKSFIPKQVKSKTRNQYRKLKISKAKKGNNFMHKKLSYNVVRGKDGKVTKRKFRATGGNHSGAANKASASKMKSKGK
ncbi:unnamed protein product [Phytomonas sp. Hart1]|nr:unnamed protein product [Phytomonas sp. Hart1]|eukprot:CCW70717.1 unnamed protein product [Phytomonas sp. isolate Hart1]